MSNPGLRPESNGFDKQAYLREMGELISLAEKRLTAAYLGIQVYTISIWTDPDAQVSAANVDTLENSMAVVERHNQWAKRHHDEAAAEGDWETAELFAPIEGRNYSIADFALREVSRIEHQSFPLHWATEADELCWELLEPALLEAAEMALRVFSKLNLHPEAELSVNSRRDWSDLTWTLRGAAE